MTDIRRTILWVVFAFSLIMLWDNWQIHNGKPATFFPGPTVATAPAPAADGVPAASTSTPATRQPPLTPLPLPASGTLTPMCCA